MRLSKREILLVLTVAVLLFLHCGQAHAQAPTVIAMSPTSGPVGALVTITGTGFGATQGSSTVSLNGTSATCVGWTDEAIDVLVPAGATSGSFSVTVNGQIASTSAFTVTPLPSGWSDGDIGSVGLAGSGAFANGPFTVKGAGQGTFSTTADSIHFTYQSLSGDGTITARVVSIQGGSAPQVGLMVRETLSPGASHVYAFEYSSAVWMTERTSTGASTSYQTLGGTGAPYWLKLTRSGNTFTSYGSPDGVNWVQLGSSQTVSMAQNVYIGLAVTSRSTSSLTTATFDNASVSSTSTPAPVISGLSATTGPVGSQLVITGSGFGASQGTSLVTLKDSAVTVNSWSSTAIIITIPSGASSGPLVVSVAPSMDNSNPVDFTVTSVPLPGGWLDQDIGQVGAQGSATYSSGTFTVGGSGVGTINETADQIHFAYEPLDGDGMIVARVVSLQGGSGSQAGVMMRQTLNSGAVTASVTYYQNNINVWDRTTTGGSTSSQGYLSATLPYWVKLVRSGGTFASYASSDGVNWVQIGSAQTISMAQTVYVGLAVSSRSNPSVSTATFDNLSITAGAIPNVIGVSPYSGGVSTPVTVTGTDFGATQGTGTVTFNGSQAASITSWSNTQIVASVPSTVPAGPGPVVVTANSIPSNATVLFTAFNPVINSLTPPSGTYNGTITVNGSGFGASQSTSQILFNGLAGYVLSWSDTAISVQVPANATSGPVTVTVNGFTSNSVQFTVTAALSITSVAPSAGAAGSVVTITGTGFGPAQSNGIVTFDGVAASVTSWSDTSIQAVVPAGAATGPVTVEVADLTAQGPTFEVTSSAQLTDSLGHQSSYSSVLAGGRWYVSNAQGSGCSSCTLRGNIQYQYDANGNVLSTTDELGNVTSDTYDSNNNVTQVTQPAVSGGTPTTTYTYNSFGEVLTMTDPLGHVTTNIYDSHGNLLTVTSPAPGGGGSASVTQFAYNSLGELTQITDPLNHVTAMTYTTTGLIATITDPQNNVATYGYDARGNRTSVTDALNHQTTFAYDLGNRLTQITYPDSTTAAFGYDYRGRRITATDQNGKTTSYAYDDADRLTSVTDAANNVTQYSYDTENNLVTITDANNHPTTFAYDAFGRVTQTTFPSNLFESYAYDADNNLTSKTDRKGQTIQYVYDALNRLTQKNYPDSTNVDYTYDLVGKVMQVNDPTGTYGFSYDNMGRLIGTSTQYSFLTGTFTNAYTYDAASNRTGYTAPDGSTNTYSYDSLNRLSTLANSWAGSFGFSYDALSRRTQMTRPNNVATNYTYDNLSRLLSVLHQLSGSTIDGATYTVDNAGNRMTKTDNRTGVTTNYGYDSIYELLQATQGGSTTESYTYDPVGNRLSSLGVSSYTNNSSNELTATSNASYTYDFNGNTASKTDSTGTTNYTWDFENRLASVTLPGTGGTVTFKYDPFWRRIERSTSSATSIFGYDGDNLVETVNSSGGVVARYAGSEEVDEPLTMQRSGATYYYEADGLGSIASLSSSAGALANTYTYDSFGNVTNSTGSVSNPFSYAGREFDSETGLFYDRARYSDPSSGRFASEDPLLFNGGDPNFYAYVGGDPVDYADPFGTDRVCHVPSLCGHDIPPPPPKYLPTNALPPGSVQYTAPGGQTFWMPAGANWCEECKAAQKNGRNPFAVALSVGQGGKYDYQRDPTNHFFYNQFGQAANYSVGVYMQCAGYPRWTTYAIGLGYGITHSSNYGKGPSQWTPNWGAGWDAAKSGKFSNPNCCK